jgi:hypothetical protein
MKPVITPKDNTPRSSQSFRLTEPVLKRFKQYCKDSGNSPLSYVMEQILTVWLDEHDRLRGR